MSRDASGPSTRQRQCNQHGLAERIDGVSVLKDNVVYDDVSLLSAAFSGIDG
jgi:hypothetical protein